MLGILSPGLRFSVGVDYWPRSSALEMWRRFDASEIADDFARIAALGLDTVRLFLRWDHFVPRAGETDPAALDRLEAVLGLAAERGLQALPSVFWLERPGNIYAGPLLEAQLALARDAGARLRAHPALRAWDIGHAFSDVREPSRGKVSTGDHGSVPAAERELAEWSRRVAGAYASASGAETTAGTHSGDLTHDRNVRLGSLCEPFGFASMQGSNLVLPFARGDTDPEAIPFLTMLTAAFSFKPVFFTGLSAPWVDDDEAASYCTAVLERLHADGRLGVLWWCWSDFPPEMRAQPPFDRAPHELAAGIVRADGSEKPVAAALSSFARERRDVVPAADMPMISSTYYYRTLPKSMQTLYDAFLDFVSARRGSP